MSTLNEFISVVKAGGFAKPSKYEVTIGKPSVISSLKYKNDNEWKKMLMFCDQASLPGVNYTTTQSRTFGEFREIPYERTFDPLQLSFYCDQQMWIKGFFDQWMANIQNSYTRVFNYYKEYTVNIQISVLDNNNKKVYGVELYECYPKTMNQIQLDYSAKDVMKMSVTMQYRYWKAIEYSKSSEAQKVSSVTPAAQSGFPTVIIPQQTATFGVPSVVA
jgi:hypothetical protein